MTEGERVEVRVAEAKALRERLVEEYHDLTGRIVRAEAFFHSENASPYTSRTNREVNGVLGNQIEAMKAYRSNLMKRMAMLGIDLSTIV